MSYWISYEKDGEMVRVPHFEGEGGTYRVGGGTEAELNVTSNYEPIVREYLPGGLKYLHGKVGREVVYVLESAVDRLGTDTDYDYWKCTAGNVGHMFSVLLGWVRVELDGVFNID